ARAGRAVGVGEVLVEVLAEVTAPDQVTAEAAVGEGDDVVRLVGEQRERNDEALVALAAGDGSADQALTKQFEDAIVRGAREMHPGVGAEKGVGGVLLELARVQLAHEERRRSRKGHELWRRRWGARV